MKSNGVYDVGFSAPEDAFEGLPYALTLVCSMSDAVIDQLIDGPTHQYLSHYRTVNSFIDHMLYRAGLFLEERGYRYIPVAASQSLHFGGERNHVSLYSHKKAAVLAGLGTVGKNSLFLHNTRGPRVRLGTLLTDCAFGATSSAAESKCGSCGICVAACPAGAMTGAEWQPGRGRDVMLSAEACNTYMRDNFGNTARGAVCGICIRVCPQCLK